MSEVCPVQFAEFPRVRTNQELFEAAGRLATSDYVCVFEPDSDLTYWAQTIKHDEDAAYHTDDPVLRALRTALEASNPHIHWLEGDSFPIDFSRDDADPGNSDNGMHADTGPEWSVGVNYHKTERLAGGGGVEITCAISTAQYTNSKKEQTRLTDLLREDCTDPDLAIPDSFRRVRLEEGGCVAFSRHRPGGLLLHDFKSLSAKRESRSWFLDGVVRKAYR